MKSDVGLVIGATGGIGAACIAELEGIASQIIAVSRTRASDQVSRPGIAWINGDIATEAGRMHVASAVRRSGRQLRFVIFASGIPHRGTIAEATADDWLRTFSVNVIGPGILLGILLDIPWTEPASIVFIGSLAARRPLPRRAVYGASKAALEHLAAAAAVELADRKISVNVASVGVTATPFMEGDRRALARFVKSSVPAGRVIQPAEVARLVRFLVEAPDVLTGSVVAMDGGAGA